MKMIYQKTDLELVVAVFAVWSSPGVLLGNGRAEIGRYQ